MSDVTSPDNDNIRSQQERDLGHKLDHDDGKAGKKPPENGKGGDRKPDSSGPSPR